MSVRFACGRCNRSISAPDKYAGRRVNCPACGAAIDVPAAAVEDEYVDLVPLDDSPPQGAEFAEAGPLDSVAGSTEDPLGAGPTGPAGTGGRTWGRGINLAGLPPTFWLGASTLVVVVLVLAGTILFRSDPSDADPRVAGSPADSPPSVPGPSSPVRSQPPMPDAGRGGGSSQPVSPTPTPPARSTRPPRAPSTPPRTPTRTPPADDRSPQSTPPASPGPQTWEVRADPLPEPIDFTHREISIPLPESGGREVVLPSRPSRFVLLGGWHSSDGACEVWNLETLRLAGEITTSLLSPGINVLSPDGGYLAQAGIHGRDKAAVQVWSVETGKQVGVVDTGLDSSLCLLDFAGADRLVTVQDSGERHSIHEKESKHVVHVWDLATDTLASQFTVMVGDVAQPAMAVSPGNTYLVIVSDSLCVYELPAGRLKGKMAISGSSEYLSWRYSDAAFSPDGRELTVVQEGRPDCRILCWNLDRGEVLIERAVTGEDARLLKSALVGPNVPFEPMPRNLGWLANGDTAVDRQSGRIIWEFPDSLGTKSLGRFLDEERLLVTGMDRSRNRVVTTLQVPLDQIAATAGALRAGGEVIDAGLPPQTEADLRSVKTVKLPRATVEWSLAPDGVEPASRDLARSPIPLPDAKVQHVAFSNPQAARAAVLLLEKTSQGSSPPGHWLEYCDLRECRSLGQIELPGLARLMALSPDGTAVAVQTSQRRLDVWSLDGGSHRCGWRLDDEVCWAEFVDADHLVTLGLEKGALTLWHLPDCRAIWTMELGMSGLPFFSPGHKYLVFLLNDRCCFLDPLTGELLGNLPTPLNCPLPSSRGSQSSFDTAGSGSWKTRAVFSSDGTRLATVSTNRFGKYVIAWDLTSGHVESFPYSGTTSGTAVNTLRWAGPRQLLAGVRETLRLIDLDRKALVWCFRLPNADRLKGGPDDRQWVVIPRSPAVYLAAVACENPQAQQMIRAQIPVDPQRVVAQGMPVSISIGSFVAGDRARIEKNLQDAIFEAGLVSGEGGLRLEVSSRRGEAKTNEYYETTGFGLFPRSGGATHTITSHEIHTRAALIDAQGKVVWETGQNRGGGQYGSISIPDGQDAGAFLRQQVADFEQHSLEGFCRGLVLPGELYPLYTGSHGSFGLGQTVLNVAAIFNFPDSTAPPRPPATIAERAAARDAGSTVMDDPVEDLATWEKRSLDYTRQTYVDLIAGDEETLQKQVRWLPVDKRPSIGVRWGAGVQFSGGSPPPEIDSASELAEITGPAFPAIVEGLEQRQDVRRFGHWPRSPDRRLQDVDFMGISTQGRFIAAARRRGIDAIVVVSLSRQTIGMTGRFDIRLNARLIYVPESNVVWASKMLSSSQVTSAREAGEDLLGEWIEQVMAEVDENFVLADMPTMRPEHVKSRVEDIMAGLSGADDPEKLLPILTELRYYVVAGLLTTEEATPPCDRILGPGKGRVLLTATPAERRAVLKQWLEADSP